MKKAILYFTLAALPSFLSAKNQPGNRWEWFLFVGAGLYQGLIAVRALQSNPDGADDKPTPVTLKQPATEPVPVKEVKS